MAASDAFYQELLEDVVPLFSEFGTTFTIRSSGGAANYNPATMVAAAGAGRQALGIVATQQLLNSIAPINFAVGDASNGWIDKKVVIFGPDLNPSQAEEVQVEGRWFSLGKVQKVQPADVVLLYILDVTA